MQQVTRKTLGAGINLTCVTTPKFKRAVLRTMLVLPLGGEDALLLVPAAPVARVTAGFVAPDTVPVAGFEGHEAVLGHVGARSLEAAVPLAARLAILSPNSSMDSTSNFAQVSSAEESLLSSERSLSSRARSAASRMRAVLASVGR